MRPDRIRLGVLAVVTVFAFPCSALAQTTTSTDAAIAELRQLLAEQRTALDRQARIIEDQGQRLAALQVRVEGGTPLLLFCSGAPFRAAGKPHGCRAHAGSARDGRFSGRVPGLDSRSGDRVGVQTRRPGAIGRGSHAERPRDGGPVRHLLDSGRTPAGRRGSAHGLLADREPLEHRAADAERERADAPVHRNRLRRRRPDVKASARVPPDQPLRRRPDLVHVLGSRGRHPRHRLRRPECDLRFRQPLFRWTPNGSGARYQWAFAVENPAPALTGAEGLNFTPDFIARLRFHPGQKRGLALYTDHIQASLLVRQLRGEVPGQSGTRLPRVASAGTSAASLCRAGMWTTASSLPSMRDPGLDAILPI